MNSFLLFSLTSQQRLIFVPQDDSDDDSSSGSDDSGSDQSMKDDDVSSSSASSSDDDSTGAAHAAAIGHSPVPPGNESVAAAPVGATAAVAAGMGANAAPASDVGETLSQEANGDAESTSKENDEGDIATRDETGDTVSEASPVKCGTARKEVTPTTDDEGDDQPSHHAMSTPQDEQTLEADASNVPMEASPDKPEGTETYIDPPEISATTPRISVTIPASEAAKIAEKGKKKSRKKRKEVTYYCPYDLNERDGDEITPLHVAIHARKLECVKLLLEAGASVHKKSDGSAPVHTAISIGAVPAHAAFAYDCTVVLSMFNADLSVKDDAMHTPLYLACAANLPQVVSFLLSDSVGLSTLNTRADRSGGRALHAAAKFESTTSGATAVSGDRARAAGGHHHPDGTISHSTHHIPGLAESSGKFASLNSQVAAASASSQSIAMVTQLLLATPGIEIDAQNSLGQTPLHIACARGNWPVVRLLLEAGAGANMKDRRGLTPGQVAVKRGMPVPNDLLPALGDTFIAANGAPPRDLIVDPHCPTLLICHELCMLHRTCPPIRRDSLTDPPPENVRRLYVLLNEADGILRGGEFGRVVWDSKARRAAMIDVLKVRAR